MPRDFLLEVQWHLILHLFLPHYLPRGVATGAHQVAKLVFLTMNICSNAAPHKLQTLEAEIQDLESYVLTMFA